MNLADCYRLLELSPGASFAEIKASYRRLARQYHPDVNLSDRQAEDKFIALTEAYKMLLDAVQQEAAANLNKQPPQNQQHQVATPQQVVTIRRKEKPAAKIPQLTETEKQFKRGAYEQLQQLLKYQRFPKAIALVENLAQRLPQDPEVRSWQASVYQRWGRELVNKKQLDKARIYLKKALKVDPHNRSLWSEVERDFRRIEKLF